jgi:hypothetical protein
VWAGSEGNEYRYSGDEMTNTTGHENIMNIPIVKTYNRVFSKILWLYYLQNGYHKITTPGIEISFQMFQEKRNPPCGGLA